jgi:hypothetical protein
MRTLALLVTALLTASLYGAEVESRVLTHYVPQDFLETAVRTENWTEVPLPVKGGIRKGDTVRLWCGGSIDRGNGEQPGENVNGPEGIADPKGDKPAWALSNESGHAYALLFKTDAAAVKKAMAAGKPLEIKLTRDGEKLYVGFNDERGRYHDNHLGKGRRHERDPLWVRVEVVRTIVD